MSLESESGWAGGRKMKGQRSEFTSIHCWLLNEIVFVSSKLERADGVFSRRDTRLEGSPITLMPNGKGMARLCLGWPNIQPWHKQLPQNQNRLGGWGSPVPYPHCSHHRCHATPSSGFGPPGSRGHGVLSPVHLLLWCLLTVPSLPLALVTGPHAPQDAPIPRTFVACN